MNFWTMLLGVCIQVSTPFNLKNIMNCCLVDYEDSEERHEFRVHELLIKKSHFGMINSTVLINSLGLLQVSKPPICDWLDVWGKWMEAESQNK